MTGEFLIVRNPDGYLTQLEKDTILWIRTSTGQLCIEVTDNDEQDSISLPIGRRGDSLLPGVHLTCDMNSEEKLLSNMSLNDIHDIFFTSCRCCQIQIAHPGTILLGSLSFPTANCAHLFNPLSKVSVSDSLVLSDVHVAGWECPQWDFSSLDEPFVTLPNGWTWYDSPLFVTLAAADWKPSVAIADLPIDEECRLLKRIYLTGEAEQKAQKNWFPQANHIMDKSGLNAGKFLTNIISILGSRIYP
jgi:hypothetical protein